MGSRLAKSDVFFYIESFYNRRHRHSALDYLSPEAYEQVFHQGVLTLLISMSMKPGEGRISRNAFATKAG